MQVINTSNKLSRLINVVAPKLLVKAQVYKFCGTEKLSEPYEYQIAFILPSESLLQLQTKKLLNNFIIWRLHAHGMNKYFHGMISKISVVKNHYTITVEPVLKCLQYDMQYRVFSKKTYPDIIETILGKLPGVKFDISALDISSYTKIPHITQYAKNSLQFLHDIIAMAGINYLFVHDIVNKS